jgi:hypothetical protein
MMVKLGIPENDIMFAMRCGVYDLLMVLEVHQIQKDIAYVWTKIIAFVEEQSNSTDEEQAACEKWDQFWEYLNRLVHILILFIHSMTRVSKTNLDTPQC